MLEWLQHSAQNGLEVGVGVVAWRLIIAVALGYVVATIYRWTRVAGEGYSPSFISTLVLLAVLIALVTQVIGNNVARAFSLVGALSIVRFRTVVQDTWDTVFVIFSVVLGMACGAGHFSLALLGLVVGGVAAFLVRPRPAKAVDREYHLSVRLGIGSKPEALLASVLEKYMEGYRLLSTSTARQGAALEVTYGARLRPERSLTDLVSELNQVQGIQNVSLAMA
jgi:hypothetical protein